MKNLIVGHSSNFPFNPTDSSDSSVFFRLYQDSSIRQKNHDILSYSNANKPKKSSRKTDMKVEDLLLQKYKQHQIKIHQQMLKAKSDELKELKPAPDINPVSKELAKLREINDEKNNPPKVDTRKSIQEILLGSRYYRKQPNQEEIKSSEILQGISTPKLTEISLKQLEEEIKASEQALKEDSSKPKVDLHLKFQEKDAKNKPKARSLIKSKSSYISSHEKIQAKEVEDFKNAVIPLEDLKKVVKSRPIYKEEEEEKPSEPFLAMSVIQRSEYWLHKREKKVRRNKQIEYENELSNCTFSPQFSPRRELFFKKNPALKYRCKSQQSQSYTVLNVTKKQYKSSSAQNSFRLQRNFSCQNSKIYEKSENSRASWLSSPRNMGQSLTPFNRTIGYRSGLDFDSFKAKAQVMVDYKTLGIKK
ncbi:unnamed protein product [Blepharisma stoltei]|uniref:Uncharacterized protein n=1 Tax=Blepharisma stoltei TaxID=1481888 RepID=A0AAU9IPW7_9CILI|nr:unnamed protein product [Blepharisma stoltei]